MTGRIRGIEKVDGGQGVLQLQIGYPGLNHGIAAFRIHAQNTVQAGQAHHQALNGHDGAAGKVGSKTARDEGYAGLMGRTHNPGHFLTVGWKHHHPGIAPGQGGVVGVKFGVGT